MRPRSLPPIESFPECTITGIRWWVLSCQEDRRSIKSSRMAGHRQEKRSSAPRRTSTKGEVVQSLEDPFHDCTLLSFTTDPPCKDPTTEPDIMTPDPFAKRWKFVLVLGMLVYRFLVARPSIAKSRKLGEKARAYRPRKPSQYDCR